MSTFTDSDRRLLDVFKFDPKYAESEEHYKELKTEILGEDSSEEESGDDGDEDDDSEDEPDTGISKILQLTTASRVLTDCNFSKSTEADGTVDVHDQTGANVVNLRRTIYLTIMSALDFEEAVHKLLKIEIGEGQEVSVFTGPESQSHS